MKTSRTKILKALPLLAAGAALSIAGPAHAEKAAKIKKLTFHTQNIYKQSVDVISTNNWNYNAIKPGSFKFSAIAEIDTKTHVFAHGWIRAMGIALGSCSGAGCHQQPVLWSHAPKKRKDYKLHKAINIHTSEMTITDDGFSVLPYDQQMIKACNAKLSETGSTGPHSTQILMKATFVADTYIALSPNFSGGTGGGQADALPSEIDHSITTTFPVKVNCVKFNKEVAEDVPDDPNYGSKGPKVFLSTFSHAETKPTPFKICKKGRVLARIETTKAGPVKFRLWTKVGNQPAQSQFIEAWSSKKGSGYKAEYKKWISVNKTTHVQAMVEDLTNKISTSSGWKDITLRCRNSGGNDGLADLPNPGNDGPPATKLKVSGEVAVLDTQKSLKPRPGTVMFKLKSNKPGALSYRIRCTGGRSWNGSLQPSKLGPGKYQVVSTKQFQVTKTEKVNCRIRNLTGKRKRVLDKASRMFKVAGRPNFKGPGGLTNRPTPTHDKPKRVIGGKLKAKKIACIGGKKAGNKCFCPARTVKKKIRANTYRCIKQVAKPNLRPLPKRKVIKRKTTNRAANRIIRADKKLRRTN